MAENIKNPVKIKYSDIPNFPVSTVVGHAGELIIGELEGKNVVRILNWERCENFCTLK